MSGLAATQPTLRSAGLLVRCHAITSWNPHGPPRPLACRRCQSRRAGPVRCRAQPIACARRLARAEVGSRAREVDEAARQLLANSAMGRRRTLHDVHPHQHLGPDRPSHGTRAFRDRGLPAWFPRTARRPGPATSVRVRTIPKPAENYAMRAVARAPMRRWRPLRAPARSISIRWVAPWGLAAEPRAFAVATLPKWTGDPAKDRAGLFSLATATPCRAETRPGTA
jgi:hypothetical protein